MAHIVLLGDSIFDNAAYTGGGPDVVTQLRQILPGGSDASLLAVDGHRTADVDRELHRLPATATHLVLSVGGNDALANIDILDRPAVSSAQVLGALAEVAGEFERRYRRRLASIALCVFNDVILRVAFERALAVVDLRWCAMSLPTMPIRSSRRRWAAGRSPAPYQRPLS